MELGEFGFGDEGDEWLLRCVGLAEVVENLSFEKIRFPLDGRAEGDSREVPAGIDRELGIEVGVNDELIAARQGDVGDEIFERILAKGFLEAEVVEKDVRFEGDLGGREFEGVVFAGDEESGVGFRVALQLGGIRGGELF